jgi:hypothetical protein
MDRYTTRLMNGLRHNWQALLIASLPGSVLRIWAVLNAERLAAYTPGADGTPALFRLALWSADHGVATLVTFPLLMVIAVLVLRAYDGPLPSLDIHVIAGPAPPASPPAIEEMTAGARELLTAVSPRGEFRVEQRGSGPAVVVPGEGPDDDRVFYDESNREVANRYRSALAELERASLVERDDSTRRLTAMGWTAARFLARQELDRIAVLVRHLSEPEQRLLRLVASCQQRYSVDKVVVRRDGTSLSAVYGNGQTVSVPGVCPLAETLPGNAAPEAASRFEPLVEDIPAEYLEALPQQRLGNPFVLRVTETGRRYVRYAEVVYRNAA